MNQFKNTIKYFTTSSAVYLGLLALVAMFLNLFNITPNFGTSFILNGAGIIIAMTAHGFWQDTKLNNED